MIVTKATDLPLLIDPKKVYNLSAIELITVKELSSKGDLIFIFPKHIKENIDKREYKSGYLQELYKELYPLWSNKKIFNFIKEHYHLFIDLRQFQKDCKSYKEKRDYYVLS